MWDPRLDWPPDIKPKLHSGDMQSRTGWAPSGQNGNSFSNRPAIWSPNSKNAWRFLCPDWEEQGSKWPVEGTPISSRRTSSNPCQHSTFKDQSKLHTLTCGSCFLPYRTERETGQGDCPEQKPSKCHLSQVTRPKLVGFVVVAAAAFVFVTLA